MFKQNTDHLQNSFFSVENMLNKAQQKQLLNSKEYHFYDIVFRNIKETDFAVLYSKKLSRPNSPINVLVSALILKEMNNWSFDDLFDNLLLNIMTRSAIGLSTINAPVFSYATIFNFQNRLVEYEQNEGVNLVENMLNSLTAGQLAQFKLLTNMQRADSTLTGENIRRYSRLQLLIECLLRLQRDLSDTDKALFNNLLQQYTENTSQNYVYRLKPSDLPHELEQIGQIYQKLHQELKGYQKSNSFKNFKRVYREHFVEVETKVEGKTETKIEDKTETTIETIVETKIEGKTETTIETIVETKEETKIEDKTETTIEVKDNKDLISSNLQSPDSPTATYRKKDGVQSYGTVINVFETCNPINPFQLITDVSVYANNVDDSTIANQRIDKVLEKTPDLSDLYTDGGYGSTDNDKKFNEHGIRHIATAIRGRQTEVDIVIEPLTNDNTIKEPVNQNDTTEQTTYLISCPNQKVKSELTNENFKAKFDAAKCAECPLFTQCSIAKSKSVYYFKEKDVLSNARKRNIQQIPKEHRSLRCNVEATMKEYKASTRNGKLRVRGTFKVMLFACCRTISINMGRIHRYCTKKCGISSKNVIFLFQDGHYWSDIAFTLKFYLNMASKFVFGRVTTNLIFLRQPFGVNF